MVESGGVETYPGGPESLDEFVDEHEKFRPELMQVVQVETWHLGK